MVHVTDYYQPIVELPCSFTRSSEWQIVDVGKPSAESQQFRLGSLHNIWRVPFKRFAQA